MCVLCALAAVVILLSHFIALTSFSHPSVSYQPENEEKEDQDHNNDKGDDDDERKEKKIIQIKE